MITVVAGTCEDKNSGFGRGEWWRHVNEALSPPSPYQAVPGAEYGPRDGDECIEQGCNRRCHRFEGESYQFCDGYECNRCAVSTCQNSRKHDGGHCEWECCEGDIYCQSQPRRDCATTGCFKPRQLRGGMQLSRCSEYCGRPTPICKVYSCNNLSLLLPLGVSTWTRTASRDCREYSEFCSWTCAALGVSDRYWPTLPAREWHWINGLISESKREL
jgi:hypothetical protein